MKEVLNNMLDYFILSESIQQLRSDKLDAVSRKEYQRAADLREQEVMMTKKVPTITEFTAWKELLNKEE
jgi:hypothetical protein